MNESFEHHPQVIEARLYIERALGGISTLHCGPLDYNVSSTVGFLIVAARVLEEFAQGQHALSEQQ